MDRFSIKEIELLTGIKAHTLRIWEKRYGIVKPLRTDTNIRYFSNDQLRKILNISTLNKAGLKISKIARLNEDGITAEIKKLARQNNTNVYFDRLTVCLYRFDAAEFHSVYAACVEQWGTWKTIHTILFPFLNHIGMLWGSKEIMPTNEHFISNLVRQKIFGAIDALPEPPAGDKPVVLFLPQHENHELGLLFACYYLKRKGVRTIYLGSNVPDTSLLDTIQQLQPSALVTTFFKGFGNDQVLNYLHEWTSAAEDTAVYFSGNGIQVEGVSYPDKCYYLEKVEDLESYF